MRKIFCFCMAAAVLAGSLSGCTKKGRGTSDDGKTEPTAETTSIMSEPAHNTARPFLGKWESYKAIVLGEEYETTYAGYPLSAVAKLDILDDGTATMIVALNPHGKERTYSYSWDITTEDGVDTLHLRHPDDPYDCIIHQGQMIMTYANIDEDTEIFLMPATEFSAAKSTTEAGLENVDFSSFMGKWESYEISTEGITYTDKLGEYPINVAFRLEILDNRSASMIIIGENQDYEWEPEKKDQLYMWSDYEGYVIKPDGDNLVINDENGLVIKLKKVDSFAEYDFSAAAEEIPEENIILEPEEETAT